MQLAKFNDVYTSFTITSMYRDAHCRILQWAYPQGLGNWGAARLPKSMKNLPSSNESREYRFLHLFQEVTRLVTSTLNLDQVLDRIVRKIPIAFGVDAATIRMLDSTGTKLLLLAASGLSDSYLDRGPVDTEESIIAAMEGSPVAIFDPDGKSDFYIGTIRDVTDHVELQKEHLAREKLQGVLEMSK